jgi:hypothetical protein
MSCTTSIPMTEWEEVKETRYGASLWLRRLYGYEVQWFFPLITITHAFVHYSREKSFLLHAVI